MATRGDEFLQRRPGPRAALSALLGLQGAQDLPERLALWSRCPDIQVLPLPAASAQRYRPAEVTQTLRAARTPQRRHVSAWRSSSFSSLTRALAQELRPSATVADTLADERYRDAQADNPAGAVPAAAADAPRNAYNDFPAGAKYGDLLHGLLEWQLLRDWPILAPPRDASALESLLAYQDVFGRRLEDIVHNVEQSRDIIRGALQQRASVGSEMTHDMFDRYKVFTAQECLANGLVDEVVTLSVALGGPNKRKEPTKSKSKSKSTSKSKPKPKS